MTAQNVISLSLDVRKTTSEPRTRVVLRAGEVAGTELAVTITDHGEPVDLTGHLAELRMLKPDGTVYAGALTATDAAAGQCSHVLDAQAATATGTTRAAYVMVYDLAGDGTRTMLCTTRAFAVHVLDAIDTSGMDSTDWAGTLDEMEGKFWAVVDDIGDVEAMAQAMADAEAARQIAEQEREAASAEAVAAAEQAAADLRAAAERGDFDGKDGKDGHDGRDGADGVSPTAKVEQTAGGATVTVTDRDGTTTANLTHGTDGRDGVSPTAKVERNATGALVTVTDGSGTTTAQLTDGQRGDTGATGPQGPAGADGYSPTATVTQTASGATITVTDKGGTTSATVHDGAAGPTGPTGPAGADGISPTVDVQPITGGHEVTITDAAGAHSFDVLDGQDGTGATITGTLTGNPATASDAIAAAPTALTVGGNSTQSSAPTPAAPVPILSVDELVLHAGDGTTDATGWPVTINLQGHVLRSLPDGTRDELTIDESGNVTLVQQVGSVDLGTMNYTSYRSTCFYTKAINDMRKAVSGRYEVMCESFAVTKSEALAGFNAGAPADSAALNVGSKYILFKTSTEYASAAAFKASVAGVTAYYQLDTPVETPLGTVTLPALPAPDVTAWATGGSATPALEVTYERNLNIVIANIEAAIADLATS